MPLLQPRSWHRRCAPMPRRRHGADCPRPALMAARLTCDCIQRVFEIWSEAFGTEFIALDAPGATELASALVGTEPVPMARIIRRATGWSSWWRNSSG